jgi:hypothetical protein
LAELHNMPLTNIRVEVDSQIDGGTASIIDCGPDGFATTNADGDGNLPILDKEPSIVTCTILIDPWSEPRRGGRATALPSFPAGNPGASGSLAKVTAGRNRSRSSCVRRSSPQRAVRS